MKFYYENDQNDHILRKLSNNDTCTISDKHTNELDRIVKSKVKDIIKDNSDNGSDMKAILCLFDTLLLSNTQSNKTKSRGLYNLTSSINDWISQMKKLDVNSVEGFVYKTKVMDDIDVIIKVPQDSDGFDNMLREYYIGLTLNKLRYITPVFVYTLGSFLCSAPSDVKKVCERKLIDKNKDAYVIYENIDGRSVTDLLKSDAIDFDGFVEIYIQLLYGLEIAQRECNFTHFDLHPGNLMVKQGNFKSYSFVLDDKIVTIKNPKYIPVVIDFGMSSVTVDDMTVGSHDFSRYGMMDFMVPGYDAYKFLNNSMFYATPETQKSISRFMSLFKNDRDPYKIWSGRGFNGIQDAKSEYCKKATFSAIAHMTPLNFIKEFIDIPILVSTQVREKIVEEPRDKFAIVKYDSMIKQYEYIFNDKQTGLEKAVSKANDCISKTPSYISGQYNIHTLELYSDKLNQPVLRSKISSMTSTLNIQKDKLIEIDRLRLDKVFDIKIPTQKLIDDTCKTILSISVTDKNNTAKEIFKPLVYHSQIEPYVEMYYTILELDLSREFEDWIKKFLDSDIYKLYIGNTDLITETERWVETLTILYSNY